MNKISTPSVFEELTIQSFTLSEGKPKLMSELRILKIKLFNRVPNNLQCLRSDNVTHFSEFDARYLMRSWLSRYRGSIRELTGLLAKTTCGSKKCHSNAELMR